MRCCRFHRVPDHQGARGPAWLSQVLMPLGRVVAGHNLCRDAEQEAYLPSKVEPFKHCLSEPLSIFQGDSEIDQLFRIFRVLRTPTEKIWPGVTAFPDFKVELRTTTITTLYIQYIFSMFQSTFPMWTKYNLEEVMKKSVDSMALNLLDQMLIYDPR